MCYKNVTLKEIETKLDNGNMEVFKDFDGNPIFKSEDFHDESIPRYIHLEKIIRKMMEQSFMIEITKGIHIYTPYEAPIELTAYVEE